MKSVAIGYVITIVSGWILKKPVTFCFFGKDIANTSVDEKKEMIPLGEKVRNGQVNYKPVMSVISSRKSVDQYVVDMPSSLDRESSQLTSEKTPYSEDSPSFSDAQTSVKSLETGIPNSVTNIAENPFQGPDSPHSMPVYPQSSKLQISNIQDKNVSRLSSSQPSQIPDPDLTNRQPVVCSQDSDNNVTEAAPGGTTLSCSSMSDSIRGSSHATSRSLPAQRKHRVLEASRSDKQCNKTTACDAEITSSHLSGNTKESEFRLCERDHDNPVTSHCTSENSVMKDVSKPDGSRPASVQGRNSGDRNQRPVNIGKCSH